MDASKKHISEVSKSIGCGYVFNIDYLDWSKYKHHVSTIQKIQTQGVWNNFYFKFISAPLEGNIILYVLLLVSMTEV